MRQSIASVALIRRQQDNQTLWLAQWNPRWQKYHFVSGHKRPDETFRECMGREIGEELGLSEDIDFQLPAAPLAHLEYTAWSDSAGAETAYTMELFEVDLIGSAAREKVEINPENRWLTEEDIRSESCKDGKPVSATMTLLLSMLRSKTKCRVSEKS
jgi:8-oxo-dGTP pyrophosphatase MutT (NUDIX family)